MLSYKKSIYFINKNKNNIFIILILIILLIIYRLYKSYKNDTLIDHFYNIDKHTVNSFDIFDTLIARTVLQPNDLFNIIEKNINFENFAKLRIQAQEMSNQSFDDIYIKFQSLTHIDNYKLNNIKEIEIITEINNIMPIMSNINKVKDGDILVSDMYLSKNDIKRLLNSAGFNKNVIIYVTPGGKSSGTIWKKLLDVYNINSHTGDNEHSDINMAKQNNITNTILTNTHKFTTIEKDSLEINPEYSKFNRKFRLLNPYAEDTDDYMLYNEQASYNIPLLCLICYRLNKILTDENRTTVLFNTRDSCLLIKIFKKLYPKYHSIVFHSSRFININYNDAYIKYIKERYNHDKSIIFDLNGCFGTGRKLFMEIFGKLPRIFIFNFNNGNTKFDSLSFLFETKFDNIEYYNNDMCGSLINFKYENGIYNDIRTPLDCPINKVKISHKTVEKFVNYIDNNIHINLLKTNNIFDNTDFWLNYYSNTLSKITPNIKFDPKIKKSLTMLANDYKSDKGNSYKDAHCYTDVYEVIIDKIVNKNKIYDINFLEIGLNNEKNDSIPSLMIWKDYFNNIGTFHGFDIQPEFSKFNNLDNNTFIYIGDQSNKHDLQQLKKQNYDIIIDDGYHSSKCQQISFVELWNNIKSNGYYIIEDLHFQPEPENTSIIVKTKELFKEWSKKNYINTIFISKDDVNKIIPTIASIEFYDSKTKNKDHSEINKDSALVVIMKK